MNESRIGLFETLRTIQFMEFSRPAYWIGQPFPSPGYLPNQGIKPRSLARQSLNQLSHKGSPPQTIRFRKKQNKQTDIKLPKNAKKILTWKLFQLDFLKFLHQFPRIKVDKLCHSCLYPISRKHLNSHLSFDFPDLCRHSTFSLSSLSTPPYLVVSLSIKQSIKNKQRTYLNVLLYNLFFLWIFYNPLSSISYSN